MAVAVVAAGGMDVRPSVGAKAAGNSDCMPGAAVPGAQARTRKVLGGGADKALTARLTARLRKRCE